MELKRFHSHIQCDCLISNILIMIKYGISLICSLTWIFWTTTLPHSTAVTYVVILIRRAIVTTLVGVEELVSVEDTPLRSAQRGEDKYSSMLLILGRLCLVLSDPRIDQSWSTAILYLCRHFVNSSFVFNLFTPYLNLLVCFEPHYC